MRGCSTPGTVGSDNLGDLEVLNVPYAEVLVEAERRALISEDASDAIITVVNEPSVQNVIKDGVNPAAYTAEAGNAINAETGLISAKAAVVSNACTKVVIEIQAVAYVLAGRTPMEKGNYVEVEAHFALHANSCIVAFNWEAHAGVIKAEVGFVVENAHRSTLRSIIVQAEKDVEEMATVVANAVGAAEAVVSNVIPVSASRALDESPPKSGTQMGTRVLAT